MVKNRFLPAYAGRAYSASPDLLAIDLRIPTYKGGEGRKEKNTVAAAVTCCYAQLISSININVKCEFLS